MDQFSSKANWVGQGDKKALMIAPVGSKPNRGAEAIVEQVSDLS